MIKTDTLTSLSSSNDSGGAAALASLIGSAVGGGASGGGAKVASTTEKTAAGGVDTNKLAEELSKPGGINAAKLAAVLKTAGGQETTHTSITPLKPIPPMWGENVLPAGLYAFDYKPLYAGPYQPVHGQTPPDPQPGAGELLGLKPFIFFCAQGPETPIPRTVREPGLAFTNLYQTPCVHPPGDGR